MSCVHNAKLGVTNLISAWLSHQCCLKSASIGHACFLSLHSRHVRAQNFPTVANLGPSLWKQAQIHQKCTTAWESWGGLCRMDRTWRPFSEICFLASDLFRLSPLICSDLGRQIWLDLFWHPRAALCAAAKHVARFGVKVWATAKKAIAGMGGALCAKVAKAVGCLKNVVERFFA